MIVRIVWLGRRCERTDCSTAFPQCLRRAAAGPASTKRSGSRTASRIASPWPSRSAQVARVVIASPSSPLATIPLPTPTSRSRSKRPLGMLWRPGTVPPARTHWPRSRRCSGRSLAGAPRAGSPRERHATGGTGRGYLSILSDQLHDRDAETSEACRIGPGPQTLYLDGQDVRDVLQVAAIEIEAGLGPADDLGGRSMPTIRMRPTPIRRPGTRPGRRTARRGCRGDRRGFCHSTSYRRQCRR